MDFYIILNSSHVTFQMLVVHQDLINVCMHAMIGTLQILTLSSGSGQIDAQHPAGTTPEDGL